MGVGLFHIIQQLSAAENSLWNILDSLKNNTPHASFFCREYWGSSSSQAQLSLERLNCNERLKRQVQQACVLESLSLSVASNLCSGLMDGVSVTIRTRLRNLLYYIHENCLVLLDMVCQRWMVESPGPEACKSGHRPENLNLDLLVRVKRYRRLKRGEHVMALRQHNEMIANVVRQLCRGAAPKRPALSTSNNRNGALSPGSPGRSTMNGGSQMGILSVVNDVMTARMPLDRLRIGTIRSKMLQHLNFRPLLNVDGEDPECHWPAEDPYVRYGAASFAQDGPIVWFEPLPPMLPNLEAVPKLPPVASPDLYTLVLDLDETLVHYSEIDGVGNYDIRPGMHEFLDRMNQLGYEIVIFTAATQDYADWVIDQIDPGRLVHHRIYRQHALPWGPIFVKDLSRLGRELDRTLIIDNVQENFMLQPNNGIFILTWYDDPQDTALFALTPLLDELITTRAKVPDILEKYRDQIPTWAGFDQIGGDYSEFDLGAEDVGYDDQGGFDDHHPSVEAVSAASVTPSRMGMPGGYQQVPLNSVIDETRGMYEGGMNVGARTAAPSAQARPGNAFDAMPLPMQPAARGPAASAPCSSRSQPLASQTPCLSQPQGQQQRACQGGYPAEPPDTRLQLQSPPQQAGMRDPAKPQRLQPEMAQPQPGVARHEVRRPQPEETSNRLRTRAQLQAEPGPAFSRSGISGPLQAPPPPAAQPFSTAGGSISGPYQAPPPSSQPMPANSQMWGRAGLGPYPVQARRR
jgi:Dullard-like phosphatase family protein